MSTNQDATPDTLGSATANTPSNPAPNQAQPNLAENTTAQISPAETKPKTHRDATRYGDWELKGRCIDF